MGRRGQRVKIARGVLRDDGGIAAFAYAGSLRRERRFPLGTPLREIYRWQDETRMALRQVAHPDRRQPSNRTFETDAMRYLDQITLSDPVPRRSEVRAWLEYFGRWRRARITPADVRGVVKNWIEAGVAPKTVQNRLNTLRHLYRVLDGRGVETPADDVRAPTPVKTPPIVVPPEVILTVEANLRKAEQAGRLRNSKTRARFMVIATTGKRPSEVQRAQPPDVDLERRVWIPRDGKGGFCPGVYLNDSMIVAWKLFIAANAWGSFRTGSFDRALHTAGWPKHIRPYNLRHSVGIALSEAGVDLADVQAHMGHKRLSTTRRHYVPVLNSRMQRASETLEGRFQWPAEAGIATVSETENTARPHGKKRVSGFFKNSYLQAILQWVRLPGASANPTAPVETASRLSQRQRESGSDPSDPGVRRQLPRAAVRPR